MVKIALDPAMYHPQLSVADEVRKAAELGGRNRHTYNIERETERLLAEDRQEADQHRSAHKFTQEQDNRKQKHFRPEPTISNFTHS